MFTGIIEEVGKVRQISHGSKSSVLCIAADQVLAGTKLGDSICTNGVCLTVVKLGSGTFWADVSVETIRRTNLTDLKPGDSVNLERALSLSDRLGGHIVSGHVDGVGRIGSIRREDQAVWFTIETPPEILKGIVEKGSVAIDGISLTVACLDSHSFCVCVIPHTGRHTTLLEKKQGDVVNLENDVIGKYVERFLTHRAADEKSVRHTIDEAYLAQHGFLV